MLAPAGPETLLPLWQVPKLDSLQAVLPLQHDSAFVPVPQMVLVVQLPGLHGSQP